LLRTIHPVVIGSAEAASQGGFNMDDPMKTAFFFSLAAFSILFADLLWHRVRLGELQRKVIALRFKSYEEED
jgi:heme exporter protein C